MRSEGVTRGAASQPAEQGSAQQQTQVRENLV